MSELNGSSSSATDRDGGRHMKTDWFSQNYERPMPLEGHEPAYTMLAAGQYLPACRCDCLQGDPGLLPHATWFDAIDDARAILTHRIHGGP